METAAPIAITIDYELLAEKITTHLEVGRGTPWMTVLEAAEYMRVSERWLRARLHDIPHSRVDGKTLLHRGEVDLWLADRER
jgi:excisionase family DNA binding protein